MPRKLSPFDAKLNDRLNLLGEPLDEHAAASNLSDMGYATPKDEFVYSQASEKEIAAKWGLDPALFHTWVIRYKLGKRREVCLRESANTLYRRPDIQEQREAWVEERQRLADKLLAHVEAQLDRGTEDIMSPSGDVETVKLTPSGLKTLAETMNLAVAIQSTALGVPTKITAAFTKAEVSHTKPIEQSVVVSPVAARPEEIEAEIEPPALPPLAGTGQVWDAQVLEPEVAP